MSWSKRVSDRVVRKTGVRLRASEARHEALIDALAEQIIAPKVCHLPVQRRHDHRPFGFQEGQKAIDQRHELLAA